MSPELIYFALVCFCYAVMFGTALIGAEALLVLVAAITVTGNVVVGKVLPIFGLQMASSACLAVCLFWIGSLLAQYHGMSAARRALWYNFGALIFLTVAGWLVMKVPGTIMPEMDTAMRTIFGFMPSVLIAALCSFGASYLFTIFVQRRFQKKHADRVPWYVATGIVAAANLIDVTIFCSIAYIGQHVNCGELIFTTWGIRLAAMLLGLPVVLLIRRLYDKHPAIPLLSPSPKNY